MYSDNSTERSSACAAGTARRSSPNPHKRPPLTKASALELYLEQRRRGLRTSVSPEADPKIVASRLEKALSNSQLGVSHIYRLLASSRRAQSPVDLTNSSLVSRLLSKQASPAQLAKLFKRHRNLERALALFFLRRHLWRKSRRPFPNMDWIANLRRIQADESSSDEESGLILTALCAGVPLRRSRSSTPGGETPVTTASAAVAQPKVAAKGQEGKRKRPSPDSEDVAASVAAATKAPAEEEDPRPSKKAKGPEPAAKKELPEERKVPAPAAVKQPVPGPAAKTESAPMAQKKAKKAEKRAEEPGTRRAAAPSPTVAASTASKPSPRGPVMSAAVPAPSSSSSNKSLDKMDYHERVVHSMLTDPLGFDDFVYDSRKPKPAHVARSFARFRNRQTQPPPPLEMRGAIGPAGDDDDDNTKSGKGRGKDAKDMPRKTKAQSLAKEAQLRAHKRKLEDKVESLKGKEKALIHGGKQSPMRDSNPAANGGRHGDKKGLTNARGQMHGREGGQKHRQGGYDPQGMLAKKFKRRG
ncbi:hypothetical protein VTJ83DRAFT_320 [Remersonia thermophila]|uniref:Uncharacterized protein n=1 Tax=Remersonia thermophila TaxID=72144 RepID=A0ABR4DLQ3_9PEZI